jgi:hypothetical protein
MGSEGCVLVEGCTVTDHRNFEVKLFQNPNGLLLFLLWSPHSHTPQVPPTMTMTILFGWCSPVTIGRGILLVFQMASLIAVSVFLNALAAKLPLLSLPMTRPLVDMTRLSILVLIGLHPFFTSSPRLRAHQMIEILTL